MLALFWLAIVLLQQHVKSESGAHWEYEGEHGPDNWYKDYSDCAGHEQSPIEIVPMQSKAYPFDSFSSSDYNKVNSNMVLQNNGHTAQLCLADDDDDIPHIQGGGLGSGTYYFRQLHFHWGRKNSEGSEHIVDMNYGRTLEMHLVHTCPDAIANGETGIAVLGVTFQVSQKENTNYQSIISALNDIKFKGSKTTVKYGPSLESLLPKGLQYLNYYRYNGSLTTPPCTEGVIWTLFQDVVDISQEQMDAFRGLLSTAEDEPNAKVMAPNFRPIQELYDRTVFKNVH